MPGPRVVPSPRVPLVLIVVVSLVLAGMAAFQPEPAAAAPPTPAAPPVTERPDQVSAMLAARTQGRRVEIVGKRSETTQVFANPDGTLTAEVFAGPVRVQDAKGTWQAIDSTLVADTTGVHPKVSKAQMRLSPGGDADLVRLRVGGRTVEQGLAGVRLPAPVLAGPTATYRDVTPGVDVTVTALATGYKVNLILKQRPAGARSWRLPLGLTGLGVTQDGRGGLRFSKPGKATSPVLIGDAPMMWDADVDPATGIGRHHAPLRVRPLSDGQGGKALEVTPDPDFLTDPALRYPITLDPVTTIMAGSDTYVASDYTTPQWSAVELRSGKAPNGVSTQAYAKWPLTTLAGKHIQSATLRMYEFWQASCTPVTIDVKALTAPFGSSTVWSNRPGLSSTVYGQGTAQYGAASCPNNWVNFPITSLVAGWVDGSITNHGLALVEHTSTNGQYARWNSLDAGVFGPRMDVTYNSLPDAPHYGAVSPCGTCSGDVWTNSDIPTLSARYTDPDGGSGTLEFQVYDATGTTLLASGSSATVTSGATASWQVPAGILSAPNTYKWRVRGNDGVDSGPLSGWVTMTIDTTAPAAPSVSSAQYPTGAWSGSDTTPGTFTFTGASEVTSFLHGLDQSPPGTSVAATSGSANVTITPPAGPRHLYVQAVDQAGNRSGIVDYAFNVNPGAVTLPAEGHVTAAKTTLQAKVAPSVTAVRFQWRRAETEAWADIPPGHVTNGGTPLSAWPLAISGGTTPALVWDVGATMGNVDGQVYVQGVVTGGTSPTTASRRFTYDQDSIDRHATDEIGPGSVDLLTGNYTVSTTDVSVDAWGSDLTLSRTYNSRDPAAGSTGAFGPGWTLNVPVDATGQEWTRLEALAGNATVLAVDEGDGIVAFARKTVSGSGTTYVAEVGSEDLTLTSNATSAAATPTQFVLSDLDGNQTIFASVGGAWKPTSTVQGGTGDTTTFKYDASGFRFAIAPKPSTVPNFSPGGYDCVTAPSLATTPLGCRAVFVSYATSTTATPTSFGNYTGRVYAAWLRAAVPSGGSWVMADTQIAAYSYDTGGRLREVWDPRISPALKTTYAYDAAGHLTTITPPGELPWTITYAAVLPDANTGRLASVSRPALPSGTATTTVVYHVPLSGGSAPYQMGPSNVAEWAQQATPVEATAVFPPDQVPASPPASWSRATITYLDVEGREVNTVSPGGHVTTTEYDQFGNTVRELSAANRACAISNTCTVPDGTPATDHPAKARLLDEQSIYTPDGLDEVERFGQLHQIQLAGGTVVPARAHTVTTYDEGAPTGGPYHLPTTVKTGAWVAGQTLDADVRTTATGYNDPDKPVSADPNSDYRVGWKLRQAITTTTDPGTSPALNLTSTTRYDKPTGLPIESRMPANPSGGDARSSKTIYYTGDASSPDAACRGKPQWANLACKTLPAAQPGTPSLPDLPISTTTYNTFNQPTVVTETIGATTRTATTTYDAAGRVTEAAVASTAGTALPSVHTSYDPASGKATTTWTSSTPAGLVAAYGFNETSGTTAADASGSGNPGTVDGATWSATGKYGGALSFDGTNDLVTVADSASLDLTTGMTLEAWVKPSTLSSWRTTVLKEHQFGLAYSLYANSATNHPASYLRIGGAEQGVEGPTQLPLSTWAHLAATYDGATLRLFVDGTQVATQTLSGSIETSGNPLRVGGNLFWGEYFSGLIDEVRVYDHALSAAEIQADRDTPVSPNATTITRTYDTLGRLTQYQDGAGNTATTGYDLLDRPTTVNDGKASRTYTYDTAIDPRGLPTSVTDTQAGTFTARYNPNSALITQGYPNGLEARTTLDATGAETRLDYVKTTSCPSDCTWLSFGVQESIHGQWLAHASPLSTQAYTYDSAGRLTKVEDTEPTQGGCITRTYTLDADTNRTNQAAYPPGTGGGCDTGGTPTTVTHSYDPADRLTDTGTSYDTFGRITALSATNAGGTTLTAGYHTNDLVRTLMSAGKTRTFTLDPTQQRVRSWQESGGTDTQLRTYHYADDSDSPAWTAETTDATGWSRNIEGIDGDLAALRATDGTITFQLANLHGDIAATATTNPADTSPTATFEATEFGQPRTGTATGPRYGWLGGKQRQTDSLTGVTLMGVRLYSPTLGRFMQEDPIVGGNANAYDYVNHDPVNGFDLDGRWGCIMCNPRYLNGARSLWRGVRRVARAYIGGRNTIYSFRVGQAAARYAQFMGGRCGYRYGMYTCSRMRWGYPRGGITIGETYITGSNRAYLTRSRIAHEKVHRAQWRRYGRWFPLRYALAGANPCRNRYERAAGLRRGGYRCP